MKALAYLIGARALDVARDREMVRHQGTEETLGPLATTAETASAWRRWSQEGKASAPIAERARRRSSEAPARRPTSA